MSNYSAILLAIVAALLLMLGFNGTYNDLWNSLFGHDLFTKPSNMGLPKGFTSDPGTTPAKPVGPPGVDPIYPPPGGDQPASSPITLPIRIIPYDELIGSGANTINWRGLFGNP